MGDGLAGFLIISWMFGAFLVGYSGRDREIGTVKALVLSLVLTPLVGLIITLQSPRIDTRVFASTGEVRRLFDEGEKKIKKQKHDEAIRIFEQILDRQPVAPMTNYYLATLHSVKENRDAAFTYLTRAIDQGFKDFAAITSSPRLKFLRTQPEFREYARNGYRLPLARPATDEDVITNLSGLGKAKADDVIAAGQTTAVEPSSPQRNTAAIPAASSRLQKPAPVTPPSPGTDPAADGLSVTLVTSRVTAAKLFLSYRREDTADAAGRLHDGLVNAFGAERVFMDIDSVPLGVDFVEHVTEQIAECCAVVVMIGRQWLTVKDKQGRARLHNDSDLVRTEVAAALRLKVPVIPVFVQDAEMPNADELPEDIRSLTRRNGLDLSAIRWRTDVERLIKELDRVMKG
jgi:TIR domain